MAVGDQVGSPRSYQVLARCASNDTSLLSTGYAAHQVIAK
jgi:hypothetical protein